MEPNLALTGEDLKNPVQPITVAEQPQPETAEEFMRGSGIIQADTFESRERDRLIQAQGEQPDLPSFEEQRQQSLRTFGTPGADEELRREQEALASLNRRFDIKDAEIEQGNSASRAQRSTDLNNRRRAIEARYHEARISALQGNIERAESIARDTVNYAFQERKLELGIFRSQLDAYSAIASDQDKQLIDRRNRQLDAAEAALQDVKDNVSAAIASGVASPEEIAVLTDPEIVDEDKLAISQEIQARGAEEQLALEQANVRSQIASRNASIELSRLKLNQELAAQGNPAGTLDGKAQTSAQLKAQGFADRVLESEQILSSIGDQFAGAFAFGSALPNQFQSAERQQFEQAKRNFINAVLRRESGAAISPSEFESAELQYFAKRGDSPEVLKQKADNRNTVINGIYRESNVPRPVMPGDVVESGGQRYQVADNGEDLIPVE